MRARWFAVASAAALAVACVDLFHATDFQTLCDREPANPACGGAQGDAGPDVEVDAARPRIDFCEWSSTEARKRAERTCAWLGACAGPLGETAFGRCMFHAVQAYDCSVNPSLRPRGDVEDLWQCLAQASTCADVDACVFPGGVASCGSAGQAGTFTACGTAGNERVRVECDGLTGGRPVGVEPCVARSKICTTRDNSVAECTGIGGEGCRAGNTCEGTALVRCEAVGGKLLDTGVDCAGYGGGNCARDGGAPFCELADGAPKCTQILACRPSDVSATCFDGAEQLVACPKLGLVCNSSAAAGFPAGGCGTPNGSGGACTQPDACSGGRVQSCGYAATPFEVDCASQGLGPCEVRANGLAACTRP